MHPLLRKTIAVIAGLLVGSVINSGVLHIGLKMITPPEGADMSTPEGFASSMHLWTPLHFLTPFLAHAIGTFAGALIASMIAGQNALRTALIIAIVFLTGGTYMVFVVPSPVWFTLVDLCLAYLPMAWLGWKLSGKGK